MSSSWHLAIESSSLGGSVALFRYDNHYRGDLHSQQVLPLNRGSVQTLAPAIEMLLRPLQLQVSQLSSLSVTCGPGSFTGLRVGLATAKMLAWTASIPAVPVDTLAAIALRFAQNHRVAPSADSTGRAGTEPGLAPGDSAKLADQYRLVTAINAFRKQVFTSNWLVSDGQPRSLMPARVVDAHAWLADPWTASLGERAEPDLERSIMDLPLCISGGAIGAYAGLNADGCWLAESELWQPMAEEVGRLGLLGLAAGQSVTADQLGPNYIRASAAEENAKSHVR